MVNVPVRDAVRTLALRLIETPLRFPLPLACAAAGTVAMMADIHNVHYEHTFHRVLLLAIMGFFLTVAAKSFAECREWPAWKGIALGFVALALAGVKVAWGTPEIHQASAAILFLIPASLLLATVAPFLGRGSDGDFWAFNRTAWLSGIFAGAGALVLFLGFSAALAATEYLFRIDIPQRAWPDVAAVSFGFVWPWLLLSGMPRDYRAGDASGMKWIERLAAFILVPLAVVYLLILYVYVARIVGLWELPRGRVAYIVAGCALYGAAVHLTTYGFRDKGARVLGLYHRLFYPAMLVPTGLMSVGIFTRIGDYGVTEGRYAVAALALWLLAMSVLHIAPVTRRLVWVPGSLAVLAVLASFGPWGAESVSLSSQMARLESVLERNRILAGDKVTPAPKRVDGEDAREVSSIVRYLQKTGRRRALRPWYAAGGVDFDAGRPSQILVEALGVRYYTRWNYPGTERFFITNSAYRGITLGYNMKNSVVDIRGYRDLAFVSFYSSKGGDHEVYRLEGKRRLRMTLDTDRGTLEIHDLKQNLRKTIELVPLIRKWRANQKTKRGYALWRDMKIEARHGRLRLRIFPVNVGGEIATGKIRVTSLQAIILVGEGS